MVSSAAIEAWLSEGESEVQEFKIRTSGGAIEEAASTACAMANHAGGRIAFGVDNVGNAVGQEVSDKTQREVATRLQAIDPPIIPRLQAITTLRGTDLLVVTVEKGRRRPYRYKGVAYKRVGTTTQEMSGQEAEALTLETVHSELRWENEPVSLPTPELVTGEITALIDSSLASGRLLTDPGNTVADHLRGLKLTKDGRLLKAAVVLFGLADSFGSDYPQMSLRLARFAGTSKGSAIEDERQLQGNAFDLLREAETFARRHLSIRALIGGELRRSDTLEIPAVALREALANAVAHRDYSVGGSVALAVYDDRVEVASPGTLHFGLQVADLYEEHESLPWNPLIADVLYRGGYIEKWGSGTTRMIGACREVGLHPPEIEQTSTSVRVVFPRSGALPAKYRSETLSPDLVDVLDKVIRLQPAATAELVDALKGQRIDVRAALQELRAVGIVRLEGHTRAARWVAA